MITANVLLPGVTTIQSRLCLMRRDYVILRCQLISSDYRHLGNYCNQGEIRKQELLKSCRILGIDNVTTLDNR